ncbi:MAG: aldehyde-activating protein [Hydrocarboniphaga sp.]|uniref:GFA family protein n=1 Tax=Hydrocarboniphaga sp. TaxID=2033016 RepID=UPI002633430E|nr:GFA family protein [Hydrocarboniphaga sp.]MDB5969260.1 aldehyde-activating protein [Hydrocarboniphaga sp.]
MSTQITHSGGCHCGAVRFEFQAPARVRVQRCNCSMCAMTGFEHLIVPGRDFQLLSGEDRLSTYTFNTGVARHRFCSVCGIKSFYVPRSNPDGFSISLRCVDAGSIEQVDYEDFDGQNWEAAGHTLAHLSRTSD